MRGILLLALLVLSHPAAAEEAVPLGQLWERPHDIAARDVLHGWGGKALVPSPRTVYRFVSEDTKGHSKGYEVVDPQGRTWDVKIGEEAQSEFVLSRVLWAVGYRQPVMYYVPRWKMEGGPTQTPPPGRFRLQSDHENEGVWEWRDNPFLETRALKGKIVINLLFNNWDLDESQNRIYRMKESAPGPTRWYVVQDLGAALGRSKIALGSRNNLQDFERAGFIEGVEEGRVKFDFRGRHFRLRNDLTPEDVVWACRLLSNLGHRQLDTIFKAAGYSASERRRFIAKIEEKIRQGLALEHRR
ncbi:MAG TPA: hypothetical protein VFV75_03505 [Candidatus Polarisedimenticolaceae bacterium]|nr:hypothetical protein [Candidatus Polarisedimenticolaceae bacterium]